MKHLILGAGNLGKDIQQELIKRGEETILMSQSMGWHYQIDGVDNLPDADVVWNCVGGFSIESTEENYRQASLSLLSLPTELMLRYRNKKVFLFSSNFAGLGHSLYGNLKMQLEQNFNTIRPNGAVFRVANLYGFHKTKETLIGKIIKYRPHTLPTNPICPTPTDWLAKIVVSNMSMFSGVMELYPDGMTNTLNLGEFILGEKINPKEHNRPNWYKKDQYNLTWDMLLKERIKDFLERLVSQDRSCAESAVLVQRHFGLPPLQAIESLNLHPLPQLFYP